VHSFSPSLYKAAFDVALKECLARRTNAAAISSFQTWREAFKAESARPTDAAIATELERQARQYMCADEREAFEKCTTGLTSGASTDKNSRCEALSVLFEACVVDRTSPQKVQLYRENMNKALVQQHIKRERSKEMASATRLHFA
jgi:hypothetical protein